MFVSFSVLFSCTNGLQNFVHFHVQAKRFAPYKSYIVTLLERFSSKYQRWPKTSLVSHWSTICLSLTQPFWQQHFEYFLSLNIPITDARILCIAIIQPGGNKRVIDFF